MPRIRKANKAFLIVSLLFLAGLALFALRVQAAPAALTQLSDQMTRAKQGTASDHTIIFRTPVLLTNSTDLVKVTFPDNFTVTGVVAADIDVYHDTTNPLTEDGSHLLPLAATADGTHWGAAFTGQVLTLTHPTSGTDYDILANDYVEIKIGVNAGGTHQITNEAAAGAYTMKIDVGPNANPTATGQIRLSIVENDQVIIDGIVDSSISFSLSANATSFGIIPTNQVKQSSPDITITAGTNGDTGYSIFVNDKGNDTNPGLFNTSASKIIAPPAVNNAPSTLSAGTEGYGIRAQQTSGTGATIETEYDSDDPEVTGVGGLTLAQQRLAYHDGAMTADDQITVYHHAAISATTPAGSYFDTVTYVISGRY